MTQDKVRKEFERFYTYAFEELPEWEPKRNCYKELEHHLAWKGWQGAREHYFLLFLNEVRGIKHDLNEILRVARDNPNDLLAFLKANYPKSGIVTSTEAEAVDAAMYAYMKEQSAQCGENFSKEIFDSIKQQKTDYEEEYAKMLCALRSVGIIFMESSDCCNPTDKTVDYATREDAFSKDSANIKRK
jgi:translation initiation factor 2 beta subunit (eIF-2beta)/eIF-5